MIVLSEIPCPSAQAEGHAHRRAALASEPGSGNVPESWLSNAGPRCCAVLCCEVESCGRAAEASTVLPEGMKRLSCQRVLSRH